MSDENTQGTSEPVPDAFERAKAFFEEKLQGIEERLNNSANKKDFQAAIDSLSEQISGIKNTEMLKAFEARLRVLQDEIRSIGGGRLSQSAPAPTARPTTSTPKSSSGLTLLDSEDEEEGS